MSLSPRDFYYEAFAEEAEADIYDTDEVILLTWSPDPAKMPTTKPHEQYKILLDFILIKAHKVFSTFAFSPELTVNGNVHIHGWCVLKDKVKYFKWFLPKLKGFGNVKIDKMKSINALGYYYKKEIEYMNEIMDEYNLPIPLTHINLESYKMRYIKKVLKNYVRNPKQAYHYKRMFNIPKKKTFIIKEYPVDDDGCVIKERDSDQY